MKFIAIEEAARIAGGYMKDDKGRDCTDPSRDQNPQRDDLPQPQSDPLGDSREL
jgi:hypothetical protein